MDATPVTPKPARVSPRLGAVALAVAGALFLADPVAAEETTLARLAKETHVHGIAVDATDASRFYLATHHGLYSIGPDGRAERISRNRDDLMGFTPHPTDPATLYASGHPAGGGNLGVTVSTDGGRNWRKLSGGVDGPVDFHQMDVSRADPRVVYGVHGGLQKSVDGGASWKRVAPPPPGLIDLAASSRHPDTLYAATQQGLLTSMDGGVNWQSFYPARAPATMVQVAGDGEVYAFVVGTGLIRASERDPRWLVASDRFGDDIILHLAVAPGDPRRIYAVAVNPATHSQAILASRDGGGDWARLGAE